MINSKIIKIASFSNNTGLKNKYTHKSSIKNSLCGDFIKRANINLPKVPELPALIVKSFLSECFIYARVFHSLSLSAGWNLILKLLFTFLFNFE